MLVKTWPWYMFGVIALAAIVGFSWYTFTTNEPTSTTTVNIPEKTTTTDPTADWKTYTNTTYNYSIKYPLNWEISNSLGEDNIQINPSVSEEENQGNTEASPALWVQLKDEINTNVSDNISNKKEVIVNNITVTEQNEGGIMEIKARYFPFGEKFIKVWWGITFEDDYPEYETMLSTFEFTEETAVADDDRILLTYDNISQYCNPVEDTTPCQEEEFNVDDANTAETYENSEKGIRVELPYNSDWGSERFRILPYETNPYNSDVISFGPISQGEGGGWGRGLWSLTFKEAKTADEVIADLNENDPDLTGQPEKSTINGINVVEYISAGMVNYYNIEVIGENYNYLFITGTSGSNNLFSDLEDIVETFEFI